MGQNAKNSHSAEQVPFRELNGPQMRSQSSALVASKLEPAAYPLHENPDFFLAAQVPPAVFLLLDQRNVVVSAEVFGNPAGNVERPSHPHLPRVKHKPDLLRGDPDVRFRHSADDLRAAGKRTLREVRVGP